MKNTSYIVLVAALGMSAPVLAQSAGATASGDARIGATSVNETAGASRAGVKGHGSGSTNLERPGGTAGRTHMDDRTDERRNRAAGRADADVRGGTGSTRTPSGAAGSVGADVGVGAGVGLGGTGVGVDANIGAGAGAGARR